MGNSQNKFQYMKNSMQKRKKIQLLTSQSKEENLFKAKNKYPTIHSINEVIHYLFVKQSSLGQLESLILRRIYDSVKNFKSLLPKSTDFHKQHIDHFAIEYKQGKRKLGRKRLSIVGFKEVLCLIPKFTIYFHQLKNNFRLFIQYIYLIEEGIYQTREKISDPGSVANEFWADAV